MPDSDAAMIGFLLDKALSLRTFAAQYPRHRLASMLLDVAEQFEEKGNELRTRLGR